MFKNKTKQNIETIKNLKNIQSQNIKDDYMLGVYNGLELALSVLEEREPNFETLTREPVVREEKEQNGRTVANGTRRR